MRAPIVRCVNCSADVKYVAIERRATMLDAVPSTEYHPAYNVRIREDAKEPPTGKRLEGGELATCTSKLYRVHKC